MNYQIYKLKFTTGVRFGTGGLNKSAGTLSADTIFSALCQEALKYGEDTLAKLVNAVRDGQLLLSDGLPYIKDRYYIPKPLMRLEYKEEGDSVVKKALKKLEYIPVDRLEQFLAGELDIKKESESFKDQFGKSDLIEKVAVRTHDENPEKLGESAPYAVHIFRYGEESGLYLCVGYQSDDMLLELGDLFLSMSYSGIGGKRSAGYGRFEATLQKPDPDFEKRLTAENYQSYMMLSTGLPADSEMTAALDGTEGYKLVKRSGFVASPVYADSFRKKKDMYLMAPGSTFQKKFRGDLFDVSSGGSHPVYRYARPVFMGVL